MKKRSALLLGITLMANVSMADLAGIKRTDLQKHDLSVPGREMVQSRVDIPPGVTAAKHRHPGEEVVYMIEGTLEYTLEGKPPVALSAGQVLFIPAGVYHSVKNSTRANAAELGTYFVEKGKPLVEIAK